MPSLCSYFQCRNVLGEKPMFRFPKKDATRLQTWIENCGNTAITHLPQEEIGKKFICIDHFQNNCFTKDCSKRKRLTKYAVPLHYKVDESVTVPPDSPVASTSGVDTMHETNLCVCCLLRPSDMDMKTSYPRNGITEIFSNMIEDCFSIKLILGNEKSGVCEECVGRLRDACDFKLQVQRSQVELLALSRSSCNKDMVPTVKSEVIDESVTCDDMLCGETTIIKLEMIEDDMSEDPLQLFTDNFAVKSERAANSDLHYSTENSPSASIVAPSLESEEPCPKCGQTFEHRASLVTHMRDAHGDSGGTRHEGETYTCDTCGTQFTQKLSLITHIKKHQNNHYPHKNQKIQVKNQQKTKQAFTCEVCNKQLINKSQLERHTRVHTGEKPFECDTCKKKYASKAYLASHIKTHTGQSPYSCEICNKKFARSAVLKRHKRSHTGEKPFSCGECNKQYTQATNLNKHKLIHKGDKCEVCNICNKRFTHLEKRQHMPTVHAGERAYSCDICLKSFVRNCDMTVHRRKHSGGKTFSCTECNKVFAHKQNLINHQRIHYIQLHDLTSDKRFKRKESLNDHTRKHTGELCTCKVCYKSFSTRGELKRHKLVHTGKSQTSTNKVILNFQLN